MHATKVSIRRLRYRGIEIRYRDLGDSLVNSDFTGESNESTLALDIKFTEMRKPGARVGH